MKNVSEATLEELSAVFEKAVKEAYEAGVNDGKRIGVPPVDEPVKVTGPYAVGDKVRFIGPAEEFTHVVTVGKVYEIFNIDVNGFYDFVDDRNGQGSISYIRPEKMHLFEKVVEPQTKTPNQQRYETIQRAREFVENKFSVTGNVCLSNQSAHCKPEFIVNPKNRMVTVLLRGCNTKKILAKGIAKCHPNEVFNADIGKAIALARALEIDIPVEFLKAIQPDEVVVGMVVRYGILVRKVLKKLNEEQLPNEYTYLSTARNAHNTIIDDTNAEYGESS